MDRFDLSELLKALQSVSQKTTSESAKAQCVGLALAVANIHDALEERLRVISALQEENVALTKRNLALCEHIAADMPPAQPPIFPVGSIADTMLEMLGCIIRSGYSGLYCPDELPDEFKGSFSCPHLPHTDCMAEEPTCWALWAKANVADPCPSLGLGTSKFKE